MKQYVARMVREKEDLAGKIKKAKAALEKRPFDMTDTGFDLLKKQVEANESNEAILARLEALETKMAAVLAATGTDNGKTLQIDSNGKVALVTV